MERVVMFYISNEISINLNEVGIKSVFTNLTENKSYVDLTDGRSFLIKDPSLNDFWVRYNSILKDASQIVF